MPYVLTLFPIEKAILDIDVVRSDVVEPLMHVTVKQIPNDVLTEAGLKIEDQVTFKFLKQQYLKCFKIAPDDRFLHYLASLEKSFDTNNVHSLIHMILTCISMPQYVNQYKFLINYSRHDLQEVF